MSDDAADAGHDPKSAGTGGADTPGAQADDAQTDDTQTDDTQADDAQADDAQADDGQADDGQAEDGADADGSRRQLVRSEERSTPPSPPRRTGVFVDVPSLRTHVGDLLRAIVGHHRVDPFGNLAFSHEGADIAVTVGEGPFGPQVGVFSVTNVDIDLSGELGSFLLATNHRLPLGAFSYDAEHRAVWLRHTLPGMTLDGPDLQAALTAIAATAARAGQEISTRFGGTSTKDASKDVLRRTPPPEPVQAPDEAVTPSGYL